MEIKKIFKLENILLLAIAINTLLLIAIALGMHSLNRYNQIIYIATVNVMFYVKYKEFRNYRNYRKEGEMKHE
ncbi:MAG: hypothetical protein RR420_00930 [Anaerovoracaceae bacterium]